MNGISIFLVLLVSLLPACGGSSMYKKKSTAGRLSHEQEARLADVPIMLDFVQKSSGYDFPGQTVLIFETASTLKELIPFYEQEMEAARWRRVAVFHGEQVTLIFEKTHKVALIKMYAGKKKGRVEILLADK